MAGKLKSIQGVEVFAVGKWNGDEYTQKDLDEMVRAFDETNENNRPALKFGHSESQTLLQKDGLPAAGWIGALYRKGKKLIADFIDIPDKVYDVLRNGAYKRVSSEIYWNARVNDKDYPRLLGAVALLGADMPGVTCLSDIFEMYAADVGELKCYDSDAKMFTIEIDKVDLQSKGAKGMDEKEQAKLVEDIAAEKQKNHALETKAATDAKELEDLRKYKVESDAKIADAEKATFEAKLESEVASLVSEKLVSPAMKPYVRELIGSDKKEYSFGEGKETKTFSKVGLLKEILKLHSNKTATVNVDESSVDSEVEGQATDGEKALQEKITKYAKDNKVSDKEAYKVVMREHLATQVDESADVEVDQ